MNRPDVETGLRTEQCERPSSVIPCVCPSDQLAQHAHDIAAWSRLWKQPLDDISGRGQILAVDFLVVATFVRDDCRCNAYLEILLHCSVANTHWLRRTPRTTRCANHDRRAAAPRRFARDQRESATLI